MRKTTHWTICTVQRRNGSFCEAESLKDAPFPICLKHASRLMEFLEAQIQATADTPELLDRLVSYQFDAVLGRAEKMGDKGYPVVYYLRVGDLIKIGTTRHLKNRVAGYPPGSELLVSEPGDVELERQRHSQFAGLLAAGREWFHPASVLIEHINKLRELDGAAPLAA